jgi:hypothetical protein
MLLALLQLTPLLLAGASWRFCLLLLLLLLPSCCQCFCERKKQEYERC